MKFHRMTSLESLWYSQAATLYAASFPLYEQRDPASQAEAMKDPAFHCDALVEDGSFAGLLYYWVEEGFTYVEHFAIAPPLRGCGTGARAMRALCAAHTSVALEIDPPRDELSTRRRGFYQRLGFVENEYAHRHPAYRADIPPHPLVVMTWPEAFSQKQYEDFLEQLSKHIMAYAEA